MKIRKRKDTYQGEEFETTEIKADNGIWHSVGMFSLCMSKYDMTIISRWMVGTESYENVRKILSNKKLITNDDLLECANEFPL